MAFAIPLLGAAGTAAGGGGAAGAGAAAAGAGAGAAASAPWLAGSAVPMGTAAGMTSGGLGAAGLGASGAGAAGAAGGAQGLLPKALEAATHQVQGQFKPITDAFHSMFGSHMGGASGANAIDQGAATYTPDAAGQAAQAGQASQGGMTDGIENMMQQQGSQPQRRQGDPKQDEPDELQKAVMRGLGGLARARARMR